MSFEVVATDGFKSMPKEFQKGTVSLKMILINKLITSLEQNPVQGEPLGKDCYKIRMAIASKGKSGGSKLNT